MYCLADSVDHRLADCAAMTTSRLMGDPAPLSIAVARWAATGESSLGPSEPAREKMSVGEISSRAATLCDTIDKAVTELIAAQEMASAPWAHPSALHGPLRHDALHGTIESLKDAHDQAHRLKFFMRTDKEYRMQTRDGGLMTPKLEQMPQHGAVKDPSQIRPVEVVEGQPLKVPSPPGPTRWDGAADDRKRPASSFSDHSWLDGYQDVEVRDGEGRLVGTGRSAPSYRIPPSED